ncbi:DEAD/DEAH box helicase family protein [Polaromonas sp.]|uniref:DEAD/DEAH box helicase n=1 Tax=Polaromonas sp. TaxID=1869339 RepID=UPI003525DE38
MIERDPLLALKAENARLIALLEANGIQWRAQPEHVVPPVSMPEPSRLSTDEKVALFRRLFRGRTDVYPIRWESKTSAKSGYSPACVNDECHHVGAVSFDAILKRTKAKYVLGLTATPIRRDGQQPIIFMQCGPIRHTAAKPAGARHDLEVAPYSLHVCIDLPLEAGIQDVFRHLANDQDRTAAIASKIGRTFSQGRKVLVLTERTNHLEAISAALDGEIPQLFVLHGRMSRSLRAAMIEKLDALPSEAPRVLLATGRLVGEGFDHPPLDTLVLAMPVSWKGTLQQYAGRLRREHANKTDVRIIDFVDTGHPALLRMWDKHRRGYTAMGYRIGG